MTFKTIIILLIAFLLTSTTFAMTLPRVANYNLDVEFQPDSAMIKGKVSVTFDQSEQIRDSITFYLHGEIWVDSIFQNGKEIDYLQHRDFYAYNYSSIATNVKLYYDGHINSQPLEIYYNGKMNPSVTRAPSNYMRIASDGVFLRAYGYSLWFPLFIEDGDKSYSVDFNEVKITVPSELHSVFVGELLDEQTVGEKSISHWTAKDVDIIDAQCSAYSWKILKKDWLNIYYRNDSVSTSQASAIKDFSFDFIKKCNERFLPNRLPKQAYIIELPRFGDISSGNVTGVSEWQWKEFDTQKWAKETFAHEFIHPFVQIPIDYSDPLASLVIEGFPSYFDDLMMSNYYGEEWLQEKLTRLEAGYLKKKETGLDRRGGKLPPDKPLDQISFFEIGQYKDYFILTSRTSLMFNYFRVKMGSEKYQKFERELFNIKRLTNQNFRDLVIRYLPNGKEDVHLWLSTIEYPEKFKLENL